MKLFEFKLCADLFEHLFEAEDLFLLPCIAFEGHELDEADMDRDVLCPCDEVTELAVIEAIHHHHIEFYMKIHLQ